MDSSPNENETSAPLQQLLIGAGVLVVVILTVIGAVLLAMQDFPAETEEATVVGQVSPTVPVSTSTLAVSEPTVTLTPIVLPSDTPTSPPPAETTASPTASPTLVPPEPTDTATTPPGETVATLPATAVLPTSEPATEQPTATPLPPPPAPTPLTTASCPPPPAWVAYRVQVGDTLNSLASRTGTTVFDLQQANCLESFTIRPGDTLYLPFTPPTPTPTYTPSPTGTRGPTPTRTSTPIAPRITNVIVRVDLDSNEVVVFVTGENFRSEEQGFRAELVGVTTVRLTIGEARTTTSFEARAPLDDLALSEYDLVVINPNGRLDIRENVFPPSDATATPTPAPPEITRVSPSSGQISRDVRLTVQGRNFRPLEPGFRVELQLDDGSLTVELSVDETIRPATSTSFDVLVFAGTLRAGLYDLLVTNPDGQTDIERFAYDAVE